MRILVVGVREAAELLDLAGQSHEVAFCSDVASARQVVAECRPDLVVLLLSVPCGPDFWVSYWQGGKPTEEELPEDARFFLDLGADVAYLEPGFSEEQLRERVLAQEGAERVPYESDSSVSNPHGGKEQRKWQ
jgi:hypothetical protein